MWLLLISMYIIQLVIVYFVLRKVYIDKPHMIGLVDILFCSVPVVGLFILTSFLPFVFKRQNTESFLNAIFFIKKSQ